MNTYTEPKTLSGTMELLPYEQILFNDIRKTIAEQFEKYGFLPLDTPIIESSEVLLAKAGGETEKQIYSFKKGDNNICLRFDLTVPLAKFVSANINNLCFPFKRYQIGKVYRGEKPQKGRYREFYQCDIDIVGKEKLSIKNDAEMPCIIYSIFSKLDIGNFVIKISNRKIMSGLLQSLNLTEKQVDIFRIIDKYFKIGKENVIDSLLNLNLTQNQIEKLTSLIEIEGTKSEKLEKCSHFSDNETFLEGINELSSVVKYLNLAKIPDKCFDIDFTIIRGLDYYTGTVYETMLTDHMEIGSICSGGRYENLAGFYTNVKLPGVGMSIGLTRLFYQLSQQKLINAEQKSVTKVLILPMSDDCLENAFDVSNVLKNKNINCEIYFEDTKFKNKLAYADKLNIPFCIIIGEDELLNNTVTIKDMLNHQQQTLPLAEAIKIIK